MSSLPVTQQNTTSTNSETSPARFFVVPRLHAIDIIRQKKHRSLTSTCRHSCYDLGSIQTSGGAREAQRSAQYRPNHDTEGWDWHAMSQEVVWSTQTSGEFQEFSEISTVGGWPPLAFLPFSATRSVLESNAQRNKKRKEGS